MSNSDQLDSENDSRTSDKTSSQSQSGDLNRRDLLKLGAAAAIAASLGAGETTATRAASLGRTPATASPAPSFFSAEEFALVDELSELIIPTDDHSPGARAAKVAEYIDFRLSESLEPEAKTTWHDGLKLIDQISQEASGKPFMQSTTEQKVAVLTRMCQNEQKPEKPEEKFFKELKSRVVGAYYSSEIGIKQEMEYKGNTYLKEFVGFDAT
jgi:gluconate 2-dehydrogenase subunit 3-like protein